MGAPKELLEKLHTAVAKDLLRRIEGGEATAADVTNALRMLKDNGIEADPAEGSPIGDLLEGLEAAEVISLEERIGSR